MQCPHPLPTAYIHGVTGRTTTRGRSGYGVILIKADGTEETCHGVPEHHLTPITSGVLKAISMGKERNIAGLDLRLTQSSSNDYQMYCRNKKQYDTLFAKYQEVGHPHSMTVDKECRGYCKAKFKSARILAQMAAGIHSLAPNPINDNLFHNGVMSVTICVFRRMADEYEYRAYGIYFDDRCVGPKKKLLNECLAPRTKPNQMDLEWMSLARTASIVANINMLELRIRTFSTPITDFITYYNEGRLSELLNGQACTDLTAQLQKLDKIECEENVDDDEHLSNAFLMVQKTYNEKMKSIRMRNPMFWRGEVRRVYISGVFAETDPGTHNLKIATVTGEVFWGPEDRRNQTLEVSGPQLKLRAQLLALNYALATAYTDRIVRIIICIDPTQRHFFNFLRLLFNNYRTWSKNGWKFDTGAPIDHADLLVDISYLLWRMGGAIEIEVIDLQW